MTAAEADATLVVVVDDVDVEVAGGSCVDVVVEEVVVVVVVACGDDEQPAIMPAAATKASVGARAWSRRSDGTLRFMTSRVRPRLTVPPTDRARNPAALDRHARAPPPAPEPTKRTPLRPA